ncbi:1794_t:CDS:2 [Diversispora eburnea]|uniref:1794_t:CDS:1 n=1 Tax=Diversispora eburnea TaxID=1213867 RepID=A0A9N8VU98_9GLOM|nr:1794_t:CDS:2 [Diversispora eburnea]
MSQEIDDASQSDVRARTLRYSTVFFQGLLNEDKNKRSKELKKIESDVNKLVKLCYPPGLSTPNNTKIGDNTIGSTTRSSPLLSNGSASANASSAASPTPNLDGGNELSFNINNINNNIINNIYNVNNINNINNIYNINNICKINNINNIINLVNNNVNNISDTSSSVTSPNPAHEVNPSDLLSVVNNNDIENAGEIRDSRRNSEDNNRRILLENVNKIAGEIRESRRSSEDDEDVNKNAGETLRILILAMLRMSIDCPLADIREVFQKFLIELRRIGVSVPIPIHPTPSRYILPEDTLTLEWLSHSRTPSFSNDEGEVSQPSPSDNDEDEVSQPTLSPPENASTIVGRQPDASARELMINTFIDKGRLSHYYRILSYFPSFMKMYQSSFSAIIESTGGPLRKSDRYYIAIMAVSQHKSQYLISKLKNEFLLHGGEAKWLDGLQNVPVKIKKLAQINSILAHQPWRLQKSHIGDLIRGPNPPDNWAVPEVVHIISILSTFHSLSSFVISCGIVPEYDCLGGYQNDEETTTGSSLGLHDNSHQASQEVAKGIGITLNNTDTTEAIVDEPINEINPDTTEETVDKSINETTGSESSSPSSPSEKPPNTPVSLRSNDFSLYLDPPEIEITYDDFSFFSEEYAPLMLRDYSWADQGVVMVNNFLPSVGELLDQEFSEIITADYSNVSPLCHQIWVYVQRLLGLQEDYINDDEQPLDDDIKNYLKKVCTMPESITEEDWKNVNYQHTEEKCHLTLIAVEARKQAELMYGLRNVMKWRKAISEKNYDNDDEK